MKLSKKEVLNLANLAKLKLSEDEINKYQKQLVDILNYVNKINELNLDKIKESTSGAENLVLELREDMVKNSDSNLIKQAYKIENNYVVVPKVLDK